MSSVHICAHTQTHTHVSPEKHLPSKFDVFLNINLSTSGVLILPLSQNRDALECVNIILRFRVKSFSYKPFSFSCRTSHCLTGLYIVLLPGALIILSTAFIIMKVVRMKVRGVIQRKC